MDPFCNICFKNYQAAKCELFCTDCQHVLCQECLKGRDFCGMCNKKCRLMKISNTMPQNMKKFFTDVRPELTGVIKIVKFQDAQRAIGANHAQRILKEYYDSKRRLEAIKKEYDELGKEFAKVKQEERSSAGSNRGSFSTLRTPQSSVSGNSAGTEKKR
uniref:RING-type domain-containing protein n=1 Tax=Lutzomyia longipalpis TaxID=7200 RepID=A0A1B0CUP0_LUTLO